MSHEKPTSTGFSRRQVLATLGAGIGASALNLNWIVSAHAQEASTITYAIHLAPTGLFFDPGNTPGTGAPLLIQFALHDGLIRPLRDTNTGLSLAEDMTEDEDGLGYTFKLRKGLTFQNGDPLTAEDVVFSFDRYKGANNSVIRSFVEKAEAVDEHTVHYVLNKPWPDFRAMFGTAASGISWVVPKKYIETVGEEGFLAKPVGAGPYKITSFTPGTELVMEAFEGYWRKKPAVDKLIFRVIPDASTRLAAVRNGEVDVAYAVQGDLVKVAQADEKLRVEVAHIPVANIIQFASMYDEGSPFADERVRRAVSMAIDREGINEAAYAGLGTVGTSIIPHVMDYYLPTPEIPYDPDGAMALLAEAGFPDGFDAGELHASADEILAPYVQANLEAIGIKVEMRLTERAAFLPAVMQKQLKGLVLAGSGAPGNAALRLQQFVVSSGSMSYLKDADLDARIQAQAVERDEEKRKAELNAIQQDIFDRSLFVSIIEHPFPVVLGPRIDYGGVNGIPGNPYTAPYEDLTLKA